MNKQTTQRIFIYGEMCYSDTTTRDSVHAVKLMFHDGRM